MIVYPENWEKIGQPIKLKKIESTILEILSDIDCNCLSFSGGIDSSVMLWLMLKIHKKVRAFTIGISQDHPDVVYAKEVAKLFGDNVEHVIYFPSQELIKREKRKNDFDGDVAVRLLYKFVKNCYANKIIACDGIDEFMCGYYAHQKDPTEKTYYNYLRRLQKEQLEPLNRNSQSINVYLPYIDKRLIFLLSQIPLDEKVNRSTRKRLMFDIANEILPKEITNWRKYGFCDALSIKE